MHSVTVYNLVGCAQPHRAHPYRLLVEDATGHTVATERSLVVDLPAEACGAVGDALRDLHRSGE